MNNLFDNPIKYYKSKEKKGCTYTSIPVQYNSTYYDKYAMGFVDENTMPNSSYSYTYLDYWVNSATTYAKPINIINNQKLNTTTMEAKNINQEQQIIESSVKFLKDKRDNPSKVVELHIDDYDALIEENAKLKADLKLAEKNAQDVIRIDYSSYDEGDTSVTYTGKDKAILDLTKKVNEKNLEVAELSTKIQKLNADHKIEIESINKSNKKEIFAEKERFENQFKSKLEKVEKEYRGDIEALKQANDTLNRKIEEANSVNRVLAETNKRFKEAINRILYHVSDKGKTFLRKRFGLRALQISENDYYVNTVENNTLYLNSDNGVSRWM